MNKSASMSMTSLDRSRRNGTMARHFWLGPAEFMRAHTNPAPSPTPVEAGCRRGDLFEKRAELMDAWAS